MDTIIIAEQGGAARTLSLRGPALPTAGTVRLGSRAQLRTEHYGDTSTQQLDGFEDEPVEASGVWSDVALADGAWASFAGAPLVDGEDLRDALDALQRAGEVLRLQIGTAVRYGRFERLLFTPLSWGELGWEWSFVPFARTSLPRATRQPPRPEEAPAGFAAAMEAALEGVEWFEDLAAAGATTTYDVLSRYVDGPLAVVTAGGRALQTAARGIDGALVAVLGAATAYADAATGYKDAVLRVGGLAGTAGAQCGAFLSALDRLCGSDLAGTDDPAAQLGSMAELGAALALGAQVGGHAARLADRSRATGQGAADAGYQVHTMRAGEDLRDVAWRYWRAPERWGVIAEFNGLAESLVQAGREVTIPPLGEVT